MTFSYGHSNTFGCRGIFASCDSGDSDGAFLDNSRGKREPSEKSKNMNKIEDFLDYETPKFWIAVIVVILIHLIPIPIGEEDVAMILFKAMWWETKSIYFFVGILAVEFIIIMAPLVAVQRFLSEKLDFN
jgi:hypothetical protein